MPSPLQQRLSKLREEFSHGQTMLAELETRQSQLRESLLRISGAIQVLEEVLAEEQAPGPGSNANIRPMEQAVETPFEIARAE